jgi:hypothetical protein
VNALLGRGEKLLFTGKEGFPLSPNPTPLFKKSGILCLVSIAVFCVKKCHDEIIVLTSNSIKECAGVILCHVGITAFIADSMRVKLHFISS